MTHINCLVYRECVCTRSWLLCSSSYCQVKKMRTIYSSTYEKRRYWPKHVPGDEIIQHFVEKDVGDADAIKDTMDAIPFYIHAMKEPDYVMMLMSTYGALLSMGETKKQHFTVDGVKKVAEFKYPEIINNHYTFQDMINNHNSFWMHPISMEETWMTMRWANCVLFPSHGNDCQCPKCSHILLEQAKIGCFAISSTNCKALDFNCYLVEEEQAKKHPR